MLRQRPPSVEDRPMKVARKYIPLAVRVQAAERRGHRDRTGRGAKETFGVDWQGAAW